MRIADELKHAFGIPDDLPQDTEALRNALHEWFTKVAGPRRVVIILDGLNEISGDSAAQQLGWLPLKFPSNVTVLISALPGEALDVLLNRGWSEIPVPLFSPAELAPAAETYFQLYSKQLPKPLLAKLEATPAACNPLFLRTTLDELRQFGKHQELEAWAEHYLSAPDLFVLFDRVLTRWDDDFGNTPGHPDIVRRALCLISCSRFGLSESEILSLLGNNCDPLPHRHWAPLYLAIENAFVIRSGLLTPGHDYLRNAIMNRWLRQPQDIRCYRQELATHFAHIEAPTTRKLDELPSLLHDLELWQPLAELLSDSQVFLKLRTIDRWRYELHQLWLPLRKHFDAGEVYNNMLAYIEAANGKNDLLLTLLNQIAQFHTEAAEYALAEPLFKRLLSMTEERHSSPQNVIAVLHNLVNVLIATDRLEEAEDLGRRALQIVQRTYGQSDPAFADALSRMATLFKQMDRFSVAAALYRRALTIREESLGVDWLSLANLQSNLASVLRRMGHFSEAESLIRSALAADASNLGRDHPVIAIRLNILASILEDTNRTREAEPVMRRALEIEESSFGPNHPDVAAYLNNLAILLSTTNRVGEAEQMHRRALNIRERVLGLDHPLVANSLSNLAKILVSNNRLREAESLYRRALDIDEARLGPLHTGVAATLNNLAELLQVQNRFLEAEPLFRRALKIRVERLGDNHHLVAESRNNLALLLRLINCPEEAEILFREALRDYELSFGPDHPEVAVVLCNLAGLLRSTNQLDEVDSLYRRALKIVEESFGPDHPKVATRLNNFAVYLEQVGRKEEAESMYKRALEIRQTRYGPNHPEVALVLSNLGCHFMGESRFEEAKPLLEMAVKILLQASADNRSEHRSLKPAIEVYENILSAMGQTAHSINKHINKLIRIFGSMD
jgi:tetratricopeptide (TPR) repeat protein